MAITCKAYKRGNCENDIADEKETYFYGYTDEIYRFSDHA